MLLKLDFPETKDKPVKPIKKKKTILNQFNQIIFTTAKFSVHTLKFSQLQNRRLLFLGVREIFTRARILQ